MFTPLKYNHYYNLHLFHPNFHHKTTRYVQNDAASTILPSMIKLTRFNLNNRPNSVFQIIKPACVTSTMAEPEEKFETPPSSPPPTPTAQVSDKKEETTIEPPTPPEKPEAGDCCGSGCVRCVWDIYYDELEDYNQLLEKYNNNNNNNNNSTKNS